MARDLGKQPPYVLAWPLGRLFAALPGGIVAALLCSASVSTAQPTFAAALTWCVSALLCSNVLAAWHWMNKGFSHLTVSITFTIAAIVGPIVGLIAAMSAHSELGMAVAFASALLGALQGATVVWFVVGPDLRPPPALRSDSEDVEGDDTPNPDTPAP